MIVKVALVTPFLSHLPYHPNTYLGYGTAVLRKKYDVDVIDINAELYFKSGEKLRQALREIDQNNVVSDDKFLHPLYEELKKDLDAYYSEIPWYNYHAVYITTPSWFPTVPTEEIVKLADSIRRNAPGTEVYFFGNSIGSWTDEKQLEDHGITVTHLNDIFNKCDSFMPVDYDSLPVPDYQNMDKYIFDMLPFRLKHGCIWGKCKFCSLARGGNSGFLERSPVKVIRELGVLIDRHDPAMLVCRDNSINGPNLLEFCRIFERFNKPWGTMARADLTGREITALRRAGCRSVYFGLESGSDRVLGSMNKGITSKQMSDFIKCLHDNDIMPAPSLIVGVPGETDDDFEQSIRFIADHKQYFEIVNVYPFMQTPASEYLSHNTQPAMDTPSRLFSLITLLSVLELKINMGEQSAEYVLFRKISPN